MSYISSKRVKTRKEHYCFGCGKVFPKGTEMESHTDADGGSIYTTYLCDKCIEYLERNKDIDEFCFGELKDLEDEE